MIQLTSKGVVFSGSATDLRALRAEFQRNHYIILPKLIEQDLFATIMNRLDFAPAGQGEDDGITAQTAIVDPLTYNLFAFLLGIPELHRLVQRITGCRRIANFRGRIYRLNPGSGERIRWHSDVYDHRMVIFSMNLTPQEYSGGTLQLRYRDSEEILHEVRNTGLGDALLMRVSRNLRHRVLPIEGCIPRTAIAGWFRWEKGNMNIHDAWRKAAQAATATESTSEKEPPRSTAVQG